MKRMKTEDLILEIVKDIKVDMNRRFDEVDKRFEQIDKRFEQVDKRFEQIDRRFEQVDKRFEQMDKRFDRLEDDVRADKDKLQDVYESREKVKIIYPYNPTAKG